MIVMKFGGTSIENAAAIARVRSIVAQRVAQRPVVVVSALARVTDGLLEVASLAATGNEPAFNELLDRLLERHMSTAEELLRVNQPVLREVEALFTELRSLLKGVCALRELTPRLSDRIASYGERLSSAIVSGVLAEAGLKPELVDARECIFTDEHFTCAVPRIEESNVALQQQLLPLLAQGKLPVLGGFIASNGKGVTTTLGRGGSDFTAALIGAALNAERVEIWTDVDGIRTTDPRLYPEAKHVDALSFHEAAELAQFGAKVLHPATLVPAIEKNIPVYVLNSRNAAHPGTCVQAGSEGPARVKAIAVKRGIVVLEVRAPRSLRRNGLARELFSVLDQHGCTPDIASVSDSSVTVAIDRKELVPLVKDGMREEVDVQAENSNALVSLVAEGIRDIPNLPARVFSALAGLEVRLVSQGASQWSFTVVVNERDVAEAVRRLHECLLDGPEQPNLPASRFERAIAV